MSKILKKIIRKTNSKGWNLQKKLISNISFFLKKIQEFCNKNHQLSLRRYYVYKNYQLSL